MRKHYILTQPHSSWDPATDQLDDDYFDANWHEKARQLQVRRWNKLKQQSI